jgi:class 3 adenylate cyclase
VRTPDHTQLGALLAAVAELLTAAQPAPAVRDPQYRLIVAVDIVGFTGQGRDDEVQVALRRALYLLLTEAFAAAGVPWENCHREDRGDGALIALPAAVSAASATVVLGPLLDHIAAGVRRHNRMASEIARLRLRAAVHAGQVRVDDYGLVGRAVNHAFRLLDAPVFKALVAGSDSCFAVIVSDELYDSTTGHAYRPVIAAHKETRAPAWVRFPSCPPEPTALGLG